MEDTPHTPEKKPCMRARSCMLNISPIKINANGMMPPAPAPCTARARINCSMLRAMPHRTEPAKKSAMATTYKRRRPYRSDSLP